MTHSSEWDKAQTAVEMDVTALLRSVRDVSKSDPIMLANELSDLELAYSELGRVIRKLKPSYREAAE